MTGWRYSQPLDAFMVAFDLSPLGAAVCLTLLIAGIFGFLVWRMTR